MAIHVRQHDNAAAFLERAESWLLRSEAEHNLILGLADRLSRPVSAYTPPYYLVTIEDGADIVGCALRTPPFKLQLTRMPVDAVRVLADDAARTFAELPGVQGPEAPARAFAEHWSALRGTAQRIDKRLRIYQLERVKWPARPAAGSPRRANTSDMALVTLWVQEFAADIGGDPEVARRQVEERIANAAIVLWIDEERPVSMAAVVGYTPNGVRVAYVYTPAELRGRGYATACVAALSQAALDEGRGFCFLYTDLANPTSNSIYQQIGYTPVSDVVDYALTTEVVSESRRS